MSNKGKPPRMVDVAKAAGVSPMTVSRAFKQDTYVNDETRTRILAAAEQLGYVMDNTASGLSSRKTGFLAVIIPTINNSNFAGTAAGVTEKLQGTGLQILLGYTGYDVEGEENLVEQLLSRRPEAIVVTGGNHTPRCRRMLENAGIPVVEMWDIPENPIDRYVGFSNAQAGRMMVRHFLDTGRRRLAFIGGDTSLDTRGFDRRRGFLAALEEAGVDPSRMIDLGPPPVFMHKGVAGMQLLMENWPDTEAVMCVSDPAGFGALTEAQRHGVDVPRELAVAGFGAFEVSEFSNPSMTTIDPDCHLIGTKTAEVILAALGEGQSGEVSGHVNIEPKLLIRQSTS